LNTRNSPGLHAEPAFTVPNRMISGQLPLRRTLKMPQAIGWTFNNRSSGHL